ncbi:MAG: hypothetical protein NTW78_03090 [Campylobacterales bacterium]|nr:hypothetical protein [Campylobacterales bacterium]
MDIGKDGCALISNFQDRKGSVTIPVVIESSNMDIEEIRKVHKHIMVVKQKQLIKNPSLIQNVTNAISDCLLPTHELNLHLDIADIQIMINSNSILYINEAQESGEDAAINAFKSILDIPCPINSADSVLLCFTIHSNFPIMEIVEAMYILFEQLPEEAEVLANLAINDSLSVEQIKVSMMLGYIY